MDILNLSVSIGVGVIVVGLVKYIFKRERDAMLTKEDHFILCKQAQDSLNEGFKEILEDKLNNLKEFVSLQIENKILKEIRKGNGKR